MQLLLIKPTHEIAAWLIPCNFCYKTIRFPLRHGDGRKHGSLHKNITSRPFSLCDSTSLLQHTIHAAAVMTAVKSANSLHDDTASNVMIYLSKQGNLTAFPTLHHIITEVYFYAVLAKSMM